MTLDEAQQQEVRRYFAQMQSNTDLLNLLNFVKPLVFAQYNRTRARVDKPFQLKSLTWYAHKALPGKQYVTFTIPKKNGNPRTIHAPSKKLKNIQQCLNVILQCVFTPNLAAMGFVAGKSIADNARPHSGRPYVFNLDLKDFFPSVDYHRVKACLKLPPFNLNDKREPLAFLIANLCCVRDSEEPKRAFLPQGAPTSPVLTNVVCQQLDRRLTGLAKRFGATYTRYADDLTFSSYTNVYQPDSEFFQELQRIITDQRFTINAQKTRLQKAGYRQEVTGLVVNDRVNVSRRYVRTVRAMLHNWESLGYDDANRQFEQEYTLDKAYSGTKPPSLLAVLGGKLEFLGMVRGREDLLYLRYRQQFETLLAKSTDQKPVELEQILDIWEKQGIEEAMVAFMKFSASIDSANERP